jgi:sphingomyelin phosphodiesterase acid-like 3
MLTRTNASCFLILVVAVAAACGVAQAAPTRGGQTWLVASDIHLEPFNASPDPALFGSDTNRTLFNWVLSAMKREVPNPSVVLLPGDFLAHDFAHVARGHSGTLSVDDEGVRTMQFVAAAFGRAFPHARFAIALGNNDAPCGDYRSSLGSSYLAKVARVWAPLVNRDGGAPDFAASFGVAGHYTMELPLRGLRLIALDDVPLATLYFGNCGVYRVNPAESELAWLQATLSTTPPGTHNVVMMHVPPGIDALATEKTRGFVLWPFLEPVVNARLLSVLSAPANRIIYAIAGHSHRFDFRLAGAVPILLFGSISPVYHNNPAFYAMNLAEDGSLRDIHAYAFDEWAQAWQLPRSFDANWQLARIDAGSLASLHVRLGSDAAMRRAWDASSSGWPSNWQVAWPMWGPLWRVPWCAQTYLGDGFAGCAGLAMRATLFQMAVALVIVGGGALVISLVVAVRARRRRRFLPNADG